MDLTPEQRYSRHISLTQIGEAGQETISQSHVLIVGLGGLGSPAALYLAAAGIGKLSFADFDTVETSNLQRQIAHNTHRVGQLKTESARTACLDINPDCEITTVDYALEEEELNALVPQCNVVLDCSDNFATRFAVNAACVTHRIPLVSGAAIRFDGQISVYDSRQSDTPCYRCLHNEVSSTIDTCAQRELAEETGYAADQWHRLGEITPVPGYSNERIHVYLASELKPTDRNLDDDEMISVHEIKFDTAVEMIKNGEIQDSKTITSLYLASIWLKEQ